MRGAKPVGDPIRLELVFVLARGKTVRREYPTVKPDIDHLIRAIFDSLTGITYFDDGQVVEVTARKVYGDTPGVQVTVSPLTSV